MTRPLVVDVNDVKRQDIASIGGRNASSGELIGVAAFEPDEENPNLGFRGAVGLTNVVLAADFAAVKRHVFEAETEFEASNSLAGAANL